MPWLDKTAFTIPVDFTDPTPGLPGFPKTQPFVHWISTTQVIILWCSIGDAQVPNKLYGWLGAIASDGALNLTSPDDIIPVADLADNEYLVSVRAVTGGGYAAETAFLSES